MPDYPSDQEAFISSDVSYDAADPKIVNEARKREGRKRKARLEMIAGIMELKQGRLWIYDMLADCHVGATPYVHGDPYATHVKIGELNVGNRLLADIGDAAPDKYMVMINEGKKNRGE